MTVCPGTRVTPVTWTETVPLFEEFVKVTTPDPAQLTLPLDGYVPARGEEPATARYDPSSGASGTGTELAASFGDAASLGDATA
jgi:hypothetical protein